MQIRLRLLLSLSVWLSLWVSHSIADAAPRVRAAKGKRIATQQRQARSRSHAQRGKRRLTRNPKHRLRPMGKSVMQPSRQLRKQRELAHKSLSTARKGAAWKHLSWKQVAGDVRKRIENPSLIDQGKQELCGPAATMNAIVSTDPQQYVRLVKEVFTKGTFRGKAIPKNLLNAKPTTVQPTDWMMLTALRSVNGRPGQKGQTGISIHSGSLPVELKGWLRRAGFKDVRSALHVFSARSHKQIDRLNQVMAAAEKNVAILFVRGGFSQHNAKTPQQRTIFDKVMTVVPSHYVRLLTPITRNGDKLSFSVFDHGHTRHYSMTEKQFGRGVVGAVTGVR